MSETLTLFTAVDLLTEVDPNMQYRMIEFLKQFSQSDRSLDYLKNTIISNLNQSATKK